MNYKESAEGITITRQRALKEIEAHALLEELPYFDEELGVKETYDAVEVLTWLGY